MVTHPDPFLGPFLIPSPATLLIKGRSDCSEGSFVVFFCVPPELTSILHSLPSLELAQCLVMPPPPYLPHLTVFEVILLRLRDPATSWPHVWVFEQDSDTQPLAGLMSGSLSKTRRPAISWPHVRV